MILGIIALLLSSASVLSALLTIERIPQNLASTILSLTDNKILILLFINLFLIMVGMFMDITASLIILSPILAPIGYSMGVHPLHFGIMICVNLNIALITPPMGGCLFTAMAVGDVDFIDLVKAIWPFILVEIAVLFLIVYVPELTMFVPRLLGFV